MHRRKKPGFFDIRAGSERRRGDRQVARGGFWRREKTGFLQGAFKRITRRRRQPAARPDNSKSFCYFVKNK